MYVHVCLCLCTLYVSSDQCCEFAWYFLISLFIEIEEDDDDDDVDFVQRFRWKTSLPFSHSVPSSSLSVSPSATVNVCLYKFRPNAMANIANRMAGYFDSNNSNNKMYLVKTDIARRWTFIVDVGRSLLSLSNMQYYCSSLIRLMISHRQSSWCASAQPVHKHTHTQCLCHCFTFARISTEYVAAAAAALGEWNTPDQECSDGTYNVKKFMEIVIEIAMKQNV